MNMRIAQTDEELLRCWPVMRELRTHIEAASDFLAQVKRQQEGAGYAIAFREDEGEVVAVAGFRISEALAWGTYMYVDDLVTKTNSRSKGHGAALLDWLVCRARAADCTLFHLDSGVQRESAHRFYFREGLTISSYHFQRPL